MDERFNLLRQRLNKIAKQKRQLSQKKLDSKDDKNDTSYLNCENPSNLSFTTGENNRNSFNENDSNRHKHNLSFQQLNNDDKKNFLFANKQQIRNKIPFQNKDKIYKATYDKTLIPKNDYTDNKYPTLNLKFNILRDTLEKLNLLIEDDISKEINETNNFVETINNYKENFEQELISDNMQIEQNLRLIKNEYNNIQLSNENDLLVKELLSELTLETQMQIPKIIKQVNQEIDTQQNTFNDINIKIKEQNNLIYEEINEEKKCVEENFLEFIKKIQNIKSEIKQFKKEEDQEREQYKNSLNEMLSDTIIKLKNERDDEDN